MQIFVNKSSNSGEGARRWEKVEKELTDKGVDYQTMHPNSTESCQDMVTKAIEAGETHIISAGGDGTVNCILNAIMNPKTDLPYEGVILGAIGLGSSNDFHKPFENFKNIEQIPLRIDTEKSTSVDVGKIEYIDTNKQKHTRYFILNASIGFVAEGNASFHSGDKVLNWLNSRSNDMAIIYSILVNLVTFKRFKASIALDQSPAKDYIVTALGILKKVQFAGDLKYDTPVTADDGMFDINLWENMGRIRLVKTLAALFDGRFTGLPQTQTWRAAKVDITPEKPVYLEFDGEIAKVRSACLSVLPKALKVCG